MNKLVVTRADDKIKDICDITHPILKKYAKDCDADFKIITCDASPPESHWRILQCKDLLDEYDRIAVLDSDMLLLKNCPNLFEIVPEDSIGVVFEDKGSRREDRHNRIKKVQDLREDVGWKSGYLNTGTFVFSKKHKSIFDVKDRYNDLGYDDVELGYQIHKQGYADDLYELSYVFNFMSMWAEPWFGAEKSDAFILHYAGAGFTNTVDRLTQIRNDYIILKKYGLIYE